MQGMAPLPALKIMWMVMMRKMFHARRARDFRNSEEVFIIRQTMRLTTMLICEITQSVSVVEREVRHLEARNRALRRDNELLRRELSRLRREPLNIQIPSGGPPPTCDEDSMGVDSSTRLSTNRFFPGVAIEDAIATTMPQVADDNGVADDSPWADESMAMDL
ncbi:hypothetical protein MTO96_041119 [Rhipicephalus appendiculatus]